MPPRGRIGSEETTIESPTPAVSDHLPSYAITCPEYQNCPPSQILAVGNTGERPLPVSDRDHFSGMTVYNFQLVLTS